MDRKEWNQRYEAVPLLWDVDPTPFLGVELAGLPPGRALDLGAGEGRNAIWLAQRGWRVTAVDFSDVALDRAGRLAEGAGVAAAITWVDADIEGFDTDPAVYDLVLIMFVHLPEHGRQGMLARAVRALAPGGTILIVGYDRTNATEGETGVQDPALLFTFDDVTARLPGLRVDRAECLRVGRAVDVVVRAVKP
ncbi:MAG: class I SAM-dependent methyltransferase [Acidimicrobiales bacterium]